MKIREVGITKARIRGLTKDNIYRSFLGDFYATKISFFEKHCDIKDISDIDYGKSYDNALEHHSQTINRFDYIGIHEDDEVVVLFDNYTFKVIAVGNVSVSFWIDVEDNFKAKRFGDLNIIITNLTVY